MAAPKHASHSMTRARRRRNQRGPALLAVVCALALAAGFLLEDFLPRDGRAAKEEAASTSMVRISEVMSSNDSALQNDAGQYSDWIELVNTGAISVGMEGYVLLNGDNALEPFIFPACTLMPGERLLIYCDGDLRADPDHPLHAPFKLDAAGVALALYDAAGARVDAVDVPSLSRNHVYRRNAVNDVWEESGDYTPGAANTLENHLALDVETSDSPLLISEAASANRTYAPDVEGRCHDYIELYNPSAETVDLSGYTLTDDEDDLAKWVFPNGASIPAGGYLLVYASGKNEGADGEMHASFKLSSEGESAILCDAQGRAVSGLDLPALLSDQAYSLDGNGEYTTALAPTPGLSNTQESAEALHAALAEENAAGVYINEFMASADEQPHDWLELYNASAQAVDVSGWGLSDDSASPRKWRFPEGTVIQPGGYLTLYLSGTDGVTGSILCASFRLNVEGGYGLMLADASGALVDRVYVPEQYTGVSYARMTDGMFLYAWDDTPDRENAAGGWRGRVAAPEFSNAGGVFDAGEAITVELSAPSGARIYYTLDSTTPDAGDALYTGPIAVSDTTVVRAVACMDGYLDSYPTAQTYVFGEGHTVRVVALVADPEDMFGEDGLYTRYRVDMEKPGHVEVYTAEGEKMLSENCALRLHGQGSRTMLQKGFKVIARSEYGTNRFKAPLFSERDYEEYQSFILRASSEDGVLTRMRDSILTSLAEGTEVFYQKTELCVVYINGEYWGHYNMRERICAASICQYEGWEGQEDQIDIVKGNSQVLRGSNASYAAMLAYVKENGVPDDETLARVGEEIDLESFIAYHALQIFVANADTLNVKRYRNLNADGKWHWAIFDLDWGFYSDTNSIRRWLNPGGTGSSNATDNTLFIALMNNPAFYDRFLTFMGDMLATEWTSGRIVSMIRERYEALAPEMPRQRERWGQSEERYERRVAELVEYARTRPRKLIIYFRDTLELTGEEMKKYFGAAMRRVEEEEAAWK